MLFPTQRPQNRYPTMPPYPNHSRFRGAPNRLGRNVPLQRAGNPTGGGMKNLLGRFLGSGGQMTNVASQGGGGLSKSLANIQQILNVVQSTAPIIQEYGPMVKNLPAMYRMMKAFKDIEKMDDQSEEKSDNEVENRNETTEVELANKFTEKSDEDRINIKKEKTVGQSMPKLYI